MLHGEDRAADSSDRARAFGFQNIVGASPLLREAISLATQVAGTRRTTVLLIGETGTGKELFSRGIHYASAAADEPFVAINCAAIPEALLESELFGHERGAFTGAHARKQGLLELAGSGTLFLDEVHQLPRSSSRSCCARSSRATCGASAASRRSRSNAGSSRRRAHSSSKSSPAASFARICTIASTSSRSRCPALRDRLEDVELIARHFLARRNARASAVQGVLGGRVHRASRAPLARERARAEERRRARGDSEWRFFDRSRRALDDSATRGEAGAPDAIGEIRIPTAGKLLDEIVAEAVTLTLKITNGNQAAAARLLGISRPTLAKKMTRPPAPSRASVA